MALMRAGFQAGKMVLAPAIGGSVGKKNVLGTNYHAEFYPPRCGEDRNRTAHRMAYVQAHVFVPAGGN